MDKKELRIIKTARTVDSINQAAKEGFRPIVKRVEPSDRIKSQYAVMQNKTTKEITIIGDRRSVKFDYRLLPSDNFEMILDWSYYYPYTFESPIAAYLVPEDIEVGERVMLEDLIEDIPRSGGQGNVLRLNSCEAIWNSEEFEIKIEPKRSGVRVIG
jgi:hypothetical protein